MLDDQSGLFICARSVDHAVDVLSTPGNKLVPIAGGTWVARQETREGTLPDGYLVLNQLEDLKGIDLSDPLSIGALSTHHEVAAALEGEAPFVGLHTAASKSATPGVRRIATVGGNLAASGFASGDLVPALLSLDAELEIASRNGRHSIELNEFLKAGEKPGFGELLIRVRMKRLNRRSAHARLTMKSAGDYPVSIVSASCSRDEAGTIVDARVSVGAVKDTAFRWVELEERLNGAALTGSSAGEHARSCLAEIAGRDDVDASGDYRVKVLPELVERAFNDIQRQYAENTA